MPGNGEAINQQSRQARYSYDKERRQVLDPFSSLLEGVSNCTHPDTYAAIGVPERWRRNGNQIQIYVLRSSRYEWVEDSPTLPGWQLQSVIPEYVEQSRIVGCNKTMRAFRAWIQERSA